MTKVLIVEDSDTVRMDLRTIIPWGKEGYEIVGEARNGSIGLEMYRNLMPDIGSRMLDLFCLLRIRNLNMPRKQSILVSIPIL